MQELDSTQKKVLVWGFSNNHGGTERVIYNIVKSLPEVQFDFLCYEDPTNYSDLFDGTHNRVFLLPMKMKHPIKNRKILNSILMENMGTYSAVWYNFNFISNIDYLLLAKKYGIDRRIAHAHNPRFPDDFLIQLFSRLNWKRFLNVTTERWAVSNETGLQIYKGMSYRVIPNMVQADGLCFSSEKREAIRIQYGVEDSFVIGTVGRLHEQKNQLYLLNLFPEIVKRKPNSKLMLVGDGRLKQELLDTAAKLNIESNVIITGAQDDIQAFLSAFDVFVFPSVYEGFGLAVLEAQYNGLPCIMSEEVGDQAIVSENVIQISLDDPELWINTILNSKRKENVLFPDKARQHDLKYIREISTTLF